MVTAVRWLAGLAAGLCALGCMPSGSKAPEGFREVTFPPGFSFGVAMAQWQACGDLGANGPIKSNWSAWLALGRAKGGQQNPRGNGFCQDPAPDLQRAVDLGVDTVRTSIDWSRIEPQPGVFDEEELDRAVAILEAIHARGLKPALTLYHWSVPLWVQNPNAAEGPVVDLLSGRDLAVVQRFEAFVRHVIPRVKHLVDTYTVINEPFSMLVNGYVQGVFPPGRLLDIAGATLYGVNMVHMHARAYDAIKALDDTDADADGVNSFVGITQAAFPVYPLDPSNPRQQFAADNINYVVHDWVIRALTTGALDVDLDGRADNPNTVPPEGIREELRNRLEFIGVQYYGAIRVVDDPLFVDLAPLYGLPMFDVKTYAPDAPHNGMGVAVSAAGFRDMLERYAQHGLPLIVTEGGTTVNGVPVTGDGGVLLEEVDQQEQAAMYVAEHMWELGRAMQRGVDVRGFWLWTLADNFEWAEGNHQRFGAYRVDYESPELPRTLNRMGEAFRDAVAARAIREEFWKTYVLDRYPTDRRANGGLTTSEPVYGR